MENIQKIKGLALIFSVVLVGVGLFDLGFYYFYGEALELGSCGLCFDLNPDLAECEFYEPVNIFDLNNITVVSYEK